MKKNGDKAAEREGGVSGETPERRKIRLSLGVYCGKNRDNTLPLMKKKQW